MKHITRRWGNPSHSKSHFGDPSRESVWDALFKRAHPQFGSDPVSAIVPLRCSPCTFHCLPSSTVRFPTITTTTCPNPRQKKSGLKPPPSPILALVAMPVSPPHAPQAETPL